MRIGINASFLRKASTGIGQVTVHFLRELIAKQGSGDDYSENEYILFVEDEVTPGLLPNLPPNFSVVARLPRYKRDDLVRKIWWEVGMLPQLVLENECDVFLSLYQSPTVLHSSIHHVMVVHDLIPKIFPQYLNNLRKKFYQNLTERGIGGAMRIITVSEHTKRDIVAYLDLDKDYISAQYISVDMSFDRIPEEDDRKMVLAKHGIMSPYIYTGGGLDERKNVESTILAYKNLLDDVMQNAQGATDTFPQLVISGSLMPQLAPLVTDVEKLVRDLNIEPHVRVLGFVDSHDLPSLYSGAEIFVFPSHYEGFGMPVLEAMKMGTAVLTADNSSLREVGGDAVAYCDDLDLEDITQKLRALIYDPELRGQYGQAGYERSHIFTWESFVSHTMELLMKQ